MIKILNIQNHPQQKYVFIYHQQLLIKKINKWFKNSYFYTCLNLGKQIKFKPKKLLKLKSKRNKETNSFAFRPDSIPRIIWDSFLMLLILYEMIMIPYRISFQSQQFDFEYYSFDFIFLFDILLNFNTAYYNSRGVLIQNRKKICIKYIKFWFWIDIISSFPYEFILVDSSITSNASLLRILRIARFFRVIKLIRIIKLRIILKKIISHLNDTLLSIYGFFKLCLWILLLAHWLACLWYYVTQYNYNHQWENYPLYNYIECLYWAVTTMLTVGYGDIVPLNTTEKMFAGAAMLFACAVFGYTLNTMSSMLKKNEEDKHDIQAMNRFMKAKKISLNVQINIRKYLEYAERQKNKFQSDDFVVKLSESLLNDLNYELKGKITETQPFFSIFSSELCYLSALELKEQFQGPDDIIFSQNPDEYVDNCLYFLDKGEVEIFTRETVFKRLNQQCIFGEIGFLCDYRTASCRSLDFVSLYQLPRQRFLNLLKGKDLVNKYFLIV